MDGEDEIAHGRGFFFVRSIYEIRQNEAGWLIIWMDDINMQDLQIILDENYYLVDILEK